MIQTVTAVQEKKSPNLSLKRKKLEIAQKRQNKSIKIHETNEARFKNKVLTTNCFFITTNRIKHNTRHGFPAVTRDSFSRLKSREVRTKVLTARFLLTRHMAFHQ